MGVGRPEQRALLISAVGIRFLPPITRWVGAGMKDGLNIKVALTSFTEHIFCIVLTEYIFVLIFPIKCKLPRFGFWFDSFQCSNKRCTWITKMHELLSYRNNIGLLWPRLSDDKGSCEAVFPLFPPTPPTMGECVIVQMCRSKGKLQFKIPEFHQYT